jgi:hypothetical protein
MNIYFNLAQQTYNILIAFGTEVFNKSFHPSVRSKTHYIMSGGATAYIKHVHNFHPYEPSAVMML